SYSEHDRQFVEKEILTAFRRNDIETWYAPADIRTGAQWERKVLTGLRSSGWFLVVMTPESADSKWVKHEVDWAIEHRAGRIIPVLLRDCPRGAFHLALPGIQHVDFRRSPGDAIKKLLGMLRPKGTELYYGYGLDDDSRGKLVLLRDQFYLTF